MGISDRLKKDIAKKELELQKLKLALKLIAQYENDAIDYTDPDTEETKLAPLPAPVNTPAPPPPTTPSPEVRVSKREHFGPTCTACDSEMYRARKTVPSGLQIEYWHCSHQGCNNEMY